MPSASYNDEVPHKLPWSRQLFVLVSIALLWMHFAIRHMDVARHSQIARDTDLPEIMPQASR